MCLLKVGYGILSKNGNTRDGFSGEAKHHVGTDKPPVEWSKRTNNLSVLAKWIKRSSHGMVWWPWWVMKYEVTLCCATGAVAFFDGRLLHQKIGDYSFSGYWNWTIRHDKILSCCGALHAVLRSSACCLQSAYLCTTQPARDASSHAGLQVLLSYCCVVRHETRNEGGENHEWLVDKSTQEEHREWSMFCTRDLWNDNTIYTDYFAIHTTHPNDFAGLTWLCHACGLRGQDKRRGRLNG